MIGFRKASRAHPGAISLEGHPRLSDDFFELARFWVSAEQGRSFCLVSQMEHWSPELLGSLLVECIQTAATGYAAQTETSEAEVLRRIWQGFEEERARLDADHSQEID